MDRDRPIGMGCMRVATAAVLTAAIDAGVDLLDTADVYGNEPLVAAARGLRPGVALTVVSKGGLLRQDSRWEPDGRAVHLEAAAAASRERLGGAPIDLYLLHAVDPGVPLATSVRALARLRERGVVARVGLSNVSRTQLEEALTITEIAAVEVALSPGDVTPVRGGLVALCSERGILVLAHRPLGGEVGARRRARDAELLAIAARHDATAAEVALAWVRTLGPTVVPIPGASRIETAVSAARAARLVLDDDGRRALDRRWLGLLAAEPLDPAVARDGDVVVLMGMPAAGKSTAVTDHVARGYLRLNRDERGGRLDQLARALDQAIADGTTRIVLDNTYPTRSSRAPVIAAARRHGVPVRCVWLDTALEDAQVNAVRRLLDRHGRLLEPAELARAAKKDPNSFAPSVQFRWRRALEPPSLDEGFAAVEVLAFERRAVAGASPALIVDLDDVVRTGRPLGADDVALVPGAADAIARWRAAGWAIAGTSWQPAIAGGETSRDAIEAGLARTADLLGGAIDVAWCPHPAGPPVCWCRKPMPGLGLWLARQHDLDLARSVHVGRGAADRGFAARLGMAYLDADEWRSAPARDLTPRLP